MEGSPRLLGGDGRVLFKICLSNFENSAIGTLYLTHQPLSTVVLTF